MFHRLVNLLLPGKVVTRETASCPLSFSRRSRHMLQWRQKLAR